MKWSPKQSSVRSFAYGAQATQQLAFHSSKAAMRNADNYARYAVAVVMGSELGMPKAQWISRRAIGGPTPWDEAIRKYMFWKWFW